MAAIYNESGHYKTIRQTCYTANIAYIVLRVIYLALFLVAKLYVLAAIAGGSVLVYLACLLLIKNRKYYPYALICGNEYFAFVIVTTILLGFNTCFHFYLIGLSVVSFFTSYFTKTHNIKAAVFWAFLSVCIYLTIYFISANRTPTYAIDKWLELTLVTIHIIVVFLFVVFYLVVFLKYALSLEKRVINESRTDELTQINNRYALYDYFAQLKDKESKILALFDIDDFKIVNDKHGHVTGDYVLKKVAEITSQVLCDSFVCRYGGEEFIMVLDSEGFDEKLETLRMSVEKETFEYEGEKLNITITIGAVQYGNNITLEKWIELADEKMYSGKKDGKNKVVY